MLYIAGVLDKIDTLEHFFLLKTLVTLDPAVVKGSREISTIGRPLIHFTGVPIPCTANMKALSSSMVVIYSGYLSHSNFDPRTRNEKTLGYAQSEKKVYEHKFVHEQVCPYPPLGITPDGDWQFLAGLSIYLLCVLFSETLTRIDMKFGIQVLL